MPSSLELDYRLRWMDFDRYGRIQPSSVLDMFQDVATIQAQQFGIGRDDMLAKGVFWAVVRTKYEVVEAPHHYEVVRVKTWPHTPTRFSFLRDYSMLNEQGDLLIKATSEWVLMDVETRKFASVKDICGDLGELEEARSFDRKPRKVPNFDVEGLAPHIIVPSYADIDVNGHVNNAVYGDYFVNALNPGEAGEIRTLQIDYRYEARAGEPLEVYTLVRDGEVLCKGIQSDGNTSFACRIELA